MRRTIQEHMLAGYSADSGAITLPIGTRILSMFSWGSDIYVTVDEPVNLENELKLMTYYYVYVRLGDDTPDRTDKAFIGTVTIDTNSSLIPMHLHVFMSAGQ